MPNNTPWDNFPTLESTTPFNIEVFAKYCSKSDNILDIGCGYGRICKLLEDYGYLNITGIDSSAVLLERAKRNLNHTKVILSDALNIPLKDDLFDVGISFGIINCLYKDGELEKYANECNRLLKDGAFLFINEYTRNDSEYFDLKYRDGFNEFKIPRVFRSNNGTTYRHYSIVNLLNAFDKNFNLIYCESKELLSQHHSRKVSGFSLILQKTIYKSNFR